MTTATPLLQSLELQIEVAESFALFGLDSLEKNFPILNQSTDEVVGHLKDAFFLTLDDVQMWVGDGLDVALDQMERLSEGAVAVVRQLQDSQVGQVASFGLDDLLTRLEEAVAHYLPLPPTLREYRGILGNWGRIGVSFSISESEFLYLSGNGEMLGIRSDQ
ncbi:perilipin-2-like, partial [Notothenia coriiceps]|uniref:Perilipin-2-like n=1 Tax=Notothenia coriiceps TaxID=8208 RepID=A0A6I9N2Q6_9TELE